MMYENLNFRVYLPAYGRLFFSISRNTGSLKTNFLNFYLSWNVFYFALIFARQFFISLNLILFVNITLLVYTGCTGEV